MAKPVFEILALEETPLGTICLRRREMLSEPGVVVTEVTLNQEFLMSSLHTASEEALATIALDMHDGDHRSVLVGGLGLGYTAHAALSCHRVERVEVVELLPEVMRWLPSGLIPLAAALNEDRRLLVRRGDIYAELAEPSGRRYDIVLIDVDHSPEASLGEGSPSFYTEPGLRRAREHLAPGGILGVWSCAESSPFADALRRVFGAVTIRPVTYFNRHVREEFTDWLLFARN